MATVEREGGSDGGRQKRVGEGMRRETENTGREEKRRKERSSWSREVAAMERRGQTVWSKQEDEERECEGSVSRKQTVDTGRPCLLPHLLVWGECLPCITLLSGLYFLRALVCCRTTVEEKVRDIVGGRQGKSCSPIICPHTLCLSWERWSAWNGGEFIPCHKHASSPLPLTSTEFLSKPY